MKKGNIINEIQNASHKASVLPSEKVWEKLVKELDNNEAGKRKPVKGLFFMQMAASLIILAAVAIFIFIRGNNSTDQRAIQLEDLHSLEINTENNLPNAGDAMTVPALLDAKAIFTSDNIIDEGNSEQKLVPRSEEDNYGLG